MQKTQFKGILMLFLTAFIWGSSFVAQSVGMENVEAFTFNGIRTLLGAATLLPFIIFSDLMKIKKHGRPGKAKVITETKKDTSGRYCNGHRTLSCKQFPAICLQL